MELNKILNADVLDIIFDGKNKDYGAYQLRKSYNKRLAKALMAMAGVIFIFFVGNVLANVLGNKKNTQLKADVVMHLEKVLESPKPVAPPPPPPPPPMTAPPPQVKMEQFTPPKIVEDIEVQDPPPTVDKLETSKIGAITTEGTDDIGIVAPPVESKGTGAIVAPVVKKAAGEGEGMIKIEKMAQFPGGSDGWKRYLERNLQYPESAQEDGRQAVIRVQLTVDDNGNVSDVKALNPELGADFASEAVRVIKKGPKWIPAEQNGRYVSYRFTQNITFQLQ